MRRTAMRRTARLAGLVALLISTLSLGGCVSRVGVGMNVGVPIGNQSYVSVGSGRWF